MIKTFSNITSSNEDENVNNMGSLNLHMVNDYCHDLALAARHCLFFSLMPLGEIALKSFERFSF